jgi:hypothetical protein
MCEVCGGMQLRLSCWSRCWRCLLNNTGRSARLRIAIRYVHLLLLSAGSKIVFIDTIRVKKTLRLLLRLLLLLLINHIGRHLIVLIRRHAMSHLIRIDRSWRLLLLLRVVGSR